MESYRVFMTKSATEDLVDISSYIANDLKEPAIAGKLVEKIKASVMRLAEFPLRNSLVSDERLAAFGFRKTMIDNYIVFYTVLEKDKTITVVRILYSRRDWINLL